MISNSECIVILISEVIIPLFIQNSKHHNIKYNKSLTD